MTIFASVSLPKYIIIITHGVSGTENDKSIHTKLCLVQIWKQYLFLDKYGILTFFVIIDNSAMTIVLTPI